MSEQTAWIGALAEARKTALPCVLVTIADAQGSAPREAGTKLLVFADGSVGTIGGGALEFRALAIARKILDQGRGQVVLREFPLGPALGQCCGGHVSLLFEPVMPAPRRLALFGAGHVGQALVPLLTGLSLGIRWIDPRPELLPAGVADPDVEHICAASPVDEVAAMPAGAAYLVMTHCHDLDYDIVEAGLRRGDAAYVGLIGSATKRARFARRLVASGLDPARLTCPIGVPGIGGKQPREIAIAVAAQILQVLSPAQECSAEGAAAEIQRLT